MPLVMVRNDITHMQVDAIVNAAQPELLGGGGVDGAIHKAAGPGLLEECRTLGGCERGQAKLTKGYNLPCKYVIHTVGPVYEDGRHGEEQVLRSCYRSSLALAKACGCQTVAFPLISAGVYGYPKDQALRVAVDAISGFLLENTDADEMTVSLVVFSPTPFLLSKKLFPDVHEYIDDHYVDTHYDACSARMRQAQFETRTGEFAPPPAAARSFAAAAPKAAPRAAREPYRTLKKLLGQIDESFTQMLLRKIDEKGMTDAQCYKKANIDRKLFSKIRSDVHYKPSKATALAFAIALELPLAETEDLLAKAGYALSPASKFDVIVEYFIRRGNYNIFEINEALFAFDQNLLGA